MFWCLQSRVAQYVIKHLPFSKLIFETEAAIHSRAEDEFDSHARGCSCTSLLSTSGEKKVAQSFSSSFPNFVRIMKKFNISGSCT